MVTMFALPFLLLFISFFQEISAQSCSEWPNPRVDLLEQLLYEGKNADAHDLSALVKNQCRLNRTTPVGAQWIRIAYHDMATHDIRDGTGGLDYSIAFELARAENKGENQGSALEDFKTVASPYISMSDLIALGVVLTSSACGGEYIPYRMGRMDNYTAGRSGVPEPHQSLEMHTDMFAQQGFNATEMIQLVACGHSAGSVLSRDFPQITPVTVLADFDTSRTILDTGVVTQYLDGTTKNALVVNTNDTVRSDFRIFSSDGNATLTSMTDPSVFSQTCARLFERMINTVPSSVTLSDPIPLQKFKVGTVLFEVGEGTIVLKTELRVLDYTTRPKTVRIHWNDRAGRCEDASCSSVAVSNKTVDSVTLPKLGHTAIRYFFEAPIDATGGVSNIWFTIEEDGETIAADNNGCGYHFEGDQDVFFFERFRSLDDLGKMAVLAVHDSITPDKVTLQTYRLSGQQTPMIREYEMILNTSITPALGYNFWSWNIEFDTGESVFDHFTIHAEAGGRAYDTEWYPSTFIDTIFEK
ncbi:heme peroxidase [Atractiella rhizophila]|nr:heme peroxidase [Atractiella rhizophila]